METQRRCRCHRFCWRLRSGSADRTRYTFGGHRLVERIRKREVFTELVSQLRLARSGMRAVRAVSAVAVGLGMGCAQNYDSALAAQPFCRNCSRAGLVAGIRDTAMGPVTEFTWRCADQEIDAKQAAYAAAKWLRLTPEACMGTYSEETGDYDYPQSVTIVCVDPVVVIVAPVSTKSGDPASEPRLVNWRSTHLLADGTVIVSLPFGVQYGTTAPYHPSAVWTIVGAPDPPRLIGDGCIIHLDGADISVQRHGDTFEVTCANESVKR